ncbi:hypothetical protein [Undibacterium pigrum]|uniref:Uncharacterized protein n=1 Tax=Undibacterium pigrum TaxID=401470 RepID=A0A318J1Z0_9BURK|nr:hypothetical protein [Undibacterium pigrum]PXX42545.1 hypothetical protein DFR42_105203 [Undibacterium pigrum]
MFLIRILNIIFLIALAFQIPVAFADEAYVIDGILDDEKVLKIESEISTLPNIKTIEFRNCYGMKSKNINQLDRLVNLFDGMKLNTAVKGVCARECALLFMLGNNKTLLKPDPGKVTVVVLHSLLSDDNEFLVNESKRIFGLIEKHSAGKIPASFFDRLFEVGDDIGGIAIYRESSSSDTNAFFSTGRKSKPVPVPGFVLDKLDIKKEQ